MAQAPAPRTHSFVFLCFWAFCCNCVPPAPRSGQEASKLEPLSVLVGARGTRLVLYVLLLTLFYPAVCWDRKNNPEPWNKLGPDDQYRFCALTADHSNLKKEGGDASASRCLDRRSSRAVPTIPTYPGNISPPSAPYHIGELCWDLH